MKALAITCVVLLFSPHVYGQSTHPKDRPVFYGSRGRAAVEGGIHFDGVKMPGVEPEKILRFYFWRIESALPSRRGKRRCAQINSRLTGWRVL
jgi:hypothetical protein